MLAYMTRKWGESPIAYEFEEKFLNEKEKSMATGIIHEEGTSWAGLWVTVMLHFILFHRDRNTFKELH